MKRLFVAIIMVLFIIGGFTGVAYADCSVTLEWSGNTETDLAGYRSFVHSKGQEYDYTNPAWEGTETTCDITGLDYTNPAWEGTETTCDITGLDYTKDYYFVVRAFDTEGFESGNSNEVSTVTNPNPVIGIGPGAPQGLAVTDVICN